MTTYLTRFAFLAALAHLALELCANFLPVVYPHLIEALGLSYTQIGLIAMVFTVGATLPQPLFGYWSDRWQPNLIVVLSIAWIGLLMGVVGLTWSYASLLMVVGLGALGSAAFHPAGATLAAANVIHRRGAALSVFSVGGNLGSAFSPLWVALGLSWLGLSGTVIIIPVAIGVSLILYHQFSQVDHFLSQTTLSQNDPEQSRTLSRSIALSLILIILMGAARSWFQLSLTTYLPEWIHSQGQSTTAAGQVLSLLLVSFSLGSLTGGPLSDMIGRWQVVGLSLAFLSLFQWFFLNSSGLVQLSLVVLMGVMVGASFPVTIVMAQEVWPRSVGLASAVVLGLSWAPGGLGAWLTGLIADGATLTTALQWLIAPPLLGVGAALIYGLLRRQIS